MEEFVARRTKQASEKIAQAEAQAAADVKTAAAEAAVRAAAVVLSQDVKAGQGGALVDRGIADLRKFLH